jgi:hypothetical protein
MYCFNYVNELTKNALNIIEAFKNLIKEEWKPTYLQFNIGTLIPFLIDKVEFQNQVCFDAKVNYSSLIFENKKIKNVGFENGTFINISIRNTVFENVHFKNCEFSEIKIEQQSVVIFKNVLFCNNHVNSIVLLEDGEVIEIAYSPERINELLIKKGINIVWKSDDQNQFKDYKSVEKSDFKKHLCRFILKFNKMSIQYEKNILKEKYLGSNTNIILEDVIPFCQEKGIIELVENKQTRQASTRAWRLLVDIEELFKNDGELTNDPLAKFWQEVNSK